MNLSALVVCADQEAVIVLRQVFDELGVRMEVCSDVARASVRQAQEHFDLMVLDGEPPADVIALLQEIRSSQVNESSLAVIVLGGQESVREMFALGINFVLYKPVSYERALSTLRAAHAVLFKDKRRKSRAAVHAHATIDYAGVERERATLVDLAEDGMAVYFGKRLPPTCKVYFQFQLPGQPAAIRLSGQIVWQDWNGRAGIQFVDVPQSSRRILSKWLQDNLSEATQRELATEAVEVEHSIQPAGKASLPVEPAEKAEQPENKSENKEEKKKDSQSRDREGVARLRSEKNRRGQTRYACRLGAEVYQQGSTVRNYCHLSDLSPGGCYLEMPLAFASGSLVEITVRTEAVKLRLSGEVRASHPGYGMGIAFKLNTKSERDGVQQLIDFVAATVESSS